MYHTIMIPFVCLKFGRQFERLHFLMSPISIAQYFKPRKCVFLPVGLSKQNKADQQLSPKSVVEDLSSDVASVKNEFV